jgi:hypothetical protein
MPALAFGMKELAAELVPVVAAGVVLAGVVLAGVEDVSAGLLQPPSTAAKARTAMTPFICIVDFIDPFVGSTCLTDSLNINLPRRA